MFLSHQTIEKYINEGKIIIGPDFDKKDIRPVGIRIHLAKGLLLPEPNQVVSLTVGQDLKYKEIDLTKEDFLLEPGQFVLGASYETIQTPPNVLAILDGRSTVGKECRSRSEEHTSELQSLAYLVCRLLLEKKKIHDVRPEGSH